VVVAAAAIVIGSAVLAAMGFVDGWKEEAAKQEKNLKKSK
jgi:hypothetical protein